MRLGSAFFKGYNTEIDNLRRRRRENAEDFRDYVRFKKEMGEEATGEELERMRNSFGRGDNYFTAGLPTSSELLETSSRLGELKADTQQTEAQNALKTVEDQDRVFGTFVKRFVNREDNDPNLEGDMQKMFEEAGQGNLWTSMGANGAWKTVHNKGRSDAISSYITSVGFNKLTSKDAIQAASQKAPEWMRKELLTIGDSQIAQFETTSRDTAMKAVEGNMADIIERAMGDKAAAEKLALDQLVSTSNGLATEADKAKVRNLINSMFDVTASGTIGKAISGLTATDTELLAAVGDDAELERVARKYLDATGYSYGPEDLKKAMNNLRTQVTAKIGAENETRIQAGVSLIASTPQETLDDLDTEEEISDFINGIFQDSQIIQQGLTDQEITDYKARLRQAALPRINSAIVSEAERVTSAISTAINDPKGVPASFLTGRSIPDRKQGYLDAINDVRREHLQEPLTMDSDEFGKLWQSAEAKIKKYFGDSYYSRISQINSSAQTTVDNNLKTQNDNISNLVAAMGGENSEALKAVAGRMMTELYIPPSEQSALIQTVKTYLEVNGIEAADLDDLALFNNVVDHASAAHSLLPKGAALAKRQQELLDLEDLVDPEMTFTDYLENAQSDVKMLSMALISKIQNLPLDTPPEKVDQIRNDYIQKIMGSLDGYKDDANQDSIKYALSGFDSQTFLDQMESFIKQMSGVAKAAQAKAKPSYFNVFRTLNGERVFQINDKDSDAMARAQQFGVHQPGVFYRMTANGTYEIVPPEEVAQSNSSDRRSSRTGR